MPTIRVLVADDQPDITEVLQYVIGIDPGLECVGCLGRADELGDAVRTLRPDVLVIDARMPGTDPLIAVRELADEFPAIKCIFYTGYDDPGFIERMIDSRAWGFVSKSLGSDAVLRAIHSVAVGTPVFPKRRGRNTPPETTPATARPAGSDTDGR